MSSERATKTLHGSLLIGSVVLALAVIVGARDRTPSAADAGKSCQRSDLALAQTPILDRRVRPDGDGSPRQPEDSVPTEPTKPVETDLQGMQPVPAPGDYAMGLESLRSLLRDFQRDGAAEDEQQEGPAMAQRVAITEAEKLQAEKDYAVAVRAYELLLSRYPQGPFVADALDRLGECRLELHDRAGAEQAWYELVQECGQSPIAPHAWRKLAAVQLLEGCYDQSLATLEAMAVCYHGTRHEQYARLQQGEVLTAAGRIQEAQWAYQTFLRDFPRSKHGRLVRRRLVGLEGGPASVMAGAPATAGSEVGG